MVRDIDTTSATPLPSTARGAEALALPPKLAAMSAEPGATPEKVVLLPLPPTLTEATELLE